MQLGMQMTKQEHYPRGLLCFFVFFWLKVSLWALAEDESMIFFYHIIEVMSLCYLI